MEAISRLWPDLYVPSKLCRTRRWTLRRYGLLVLGRIVDAERPVGRWAFARALRSAPSRALLAPAGVLVIEQERGS